MPLLALASLDAHPANANRMAAGLFAKLKLHLERSGEYPPLIVRRHPARSDRFEILDGHHRARALRELGYEEARCEIWEVDDDSRAALLLLTLNRLHGEDDPYKRGLLMDVLAHSMDEESLANLLPDSAEQIRALIDLTRPPPPESALAKPPDLDQMPRAVTFFLTGPQHDRLTRTLRHVNAEDRSAALVKLLRLNHEACAESLAMRPFN